MLRYLILYALSLSALEKKRQENWRSVAVKKRPCLTIRLLAERSLDALSETQTIFSFLSTAAAFFVYFLGLKPKSKSLCGSSTKELPKGKTALPQILSDVRNYSLRAIFWTATLGWGQMWIFYFIPNFTLFKKWNISLFKKVSFVLKITPKHSLSLLLNSQIIQIMGVK